MSMAAIMQTSPQPWTITSILQHAYGRIVLADNERACLSLGCFYFIEGPFAATFLQPLLQHLTAPAIIISSNQHWYDYLLQYTDIGLKQVTRCMFIWNSDANSLAAYLKLPQADYSIKRLDSETCEQLLHLEWAEGVFDSYDGTENFLNKGFGFCLLHHNRIVSICMSFAESKHGIEIEVDTDPNYQGRGLAKIVSAYFVTETLRRSKTPLWDASNLASAKIATALGFSQGSEYVALSTF